MSGTEWLDRLRAGRRLWAESGRAYLDSMEGRSVAYPTQATREAEVVCRLARRRYEEMLAGFEHWLDGEEEAGD